MHRDYLFPIFLKRSLRLREKVWLIQGQASHLCHCSGQVSSGLGGRRTEATQAGLAIRKLWRWVLCRVPGGLLRKVNGGRMAGEIFAPALRWH